MEASFQRRLLSGNIDLLEETGGRRQEFQILAVAGEGGSTVAYQAIRHSTGGPVKGILKEFYPLDAAGRVGYGLVRGAGGQLTAGPGFGRRFAAECRAYLSRYRLIDSVVAETPAAGVLKNYIEQGRPFFGIPAEDTPATVYVFSPSLDGVGFDQYLAGLRTGPIPEPENALLQILQTLHTLTDAVKAMHTAGLLHLDLKPSNFLVARDSEGGLAPAHISLFDVNTVRSVDEDGALEPMRTGTEGYAAPELEVDGPSDRSDLFSLGAILFSGVVLCPDEMPDGRYRPALYGQIDRLLRTSRLLAGSDVNSDPMLRTRLAGILEKTLAADPAQRYNSLSELKTELAQCISRIHELRVLPISEAGVSDPLVLFQKLLYRWPLYRYLPGQGSLNVLLLGAGTYAQGFTDAVLQAGQNGFFVRLTAASHRPEADREAYLRLRPALTRFVEVQGSPAPEQPYAALRFTGLGEDGCSSLQVDHRAHNERLLRQLAEETGPEEEYHYCFVSLGADSLNSETARQLAAVLRGQYGHAVPVFYARSTPDDRPRAEGEAIPVWIREPLDRADGIAPGLDRMALNTHLCWKGSNYDAQTARQKFFDPNNRYDYVGSLASALSIPYKLFSLGMVDAKHTFDPQQAAQRFRQEVLDKKKTDPAARQKFDRLAWYEHRRWVMEKVCAGWQAPLLADGTPDVDSCVRRGAVRDEKNRLHPCLVRSTESAPLSGPEWSDHSRWGKGPVDPALDPLDRLSVLLHRAFAQRAEQAVRTENLLQCPSLQELRTLAASDKTLVQAVSYFELTLKNILNRSESAARQYGSYAHAVSAAAAEALPPAAAGRVDALLNDLQARFFPIVEASLYREYKANDRSMIESIPFILLNRPTESLGMIFPAGTGGQDALRSVAGAAMLNPAALVYFYCFTPGSSADALYGRAGAAIRYLKRRRNHCAVHFVVGCTAAVDETARAGLEQALQRLAGQYPPGSGNCWVQRCECLPCADTADCARKFLQRLHAEPVQLFDGSSPLFASADENAGFMEQVLRDLPQTGCFTLDPASKRFHLPEPDSRTLWLRERNDDSFLRAEDVLALMNAPFRLEMPEFAGDIDPLWAAYTGSDLPETPDRFARGVQRWSCLCERLERYEAARPVLAQLNPLPDGAPARCTEWQLPGYLFEPLRRLLPELARYGAIRPDAAVTSRTSDTCILRLASSGANLARLDAVFDRPYRLLDYCHPRVFPRQENGAATVCIAADDLTVTGLRLRPQGEAGKDEVFRACCRLLSVLAGAGYLRQLKTDGTAGTVSFVYTSPRIRDLLCRAGRILGMKVFYEALYTGFWDDVAAVRFAGENDGTGRLDLVLCKGFRHMVCRCESLPEPLPAAPDALPGDVCAAGATICVSAGGERPEVCTVRGPNDVRSIVAALQRRMETAL